MASLTVDADISCIDDRVLGQEQELEEICSTLDGKTTNLFVEFMMKVTKFEELVDVGKKFLAGFHQEIEKFRRPELPETSSKISEIISANWNERMKVYVEAGCRHHHQSIKSICNLHSCVQGLLDHLMKVEALLDEVVSLVEDVICLTKAANKNISTILHYFSGVAKEEIGFKHLEDTSISQVIIMEAISHMLKLDYAMQKNIVEALNMKTSSPELESYCLMWDLHPYINDGVLRLAWELIPPRDQFVPSGESKVQKHVGGNDNLQALFKSNFIYRVITAFLAFDRFLSTCTHIIIKRLCS